jgi:hypothetical protein
MASEDTQYEQALRFSLCFWVEGLNTLTYKEKGEVLRLRKECKWWWWCASVKECQ